MNPIQLKLEQVYKEYLEYKNFVEADKRTLDEIRADVAKKINVEDDDNMEAIFDEHGVNRIMQEELIKQKQKFYNYYYAYESLAEIPEYMTEEIKQIDFKQMFLVKNGKKEIVDKDYYDLTKKQFIEAVKQQKIEFEKQKAEYDKMLKSQE